MHISKHAIQLPKKILISTDSTTKFYVRDGRQEVMLCKQVL